MKEYDFYIVPTPIGNLGDITLRAIDVLKSVDIIACEDSRVTQKLLNHYDIRTKCLSYHKYNEKERVEQIIKILESGQKMALVSDAGTPLICDPGSVIVKELRQKGFSVTALPGANAVITFLSQISRENEAFSFIGFLPKTEPKIKKLVQDYKDKNFIFYESPNRILQTLNIIRSVSPDAQIAVGRELTKIFEEIIVDKIDNVIEHFNNNQPRGEFVVMVLCSDNSSDDYEIRKNVKLLQDKCFSPKDISVILSELFGYNKNKVYKICIDK